MTFSSIDQIFSTNDAAHKDFVELVGRVPHEDARAKREGEKWSIAEIVEHLAMSEAGMSRICAKLIKKAETNGEPADGRIEVTDVFEERGVAIVKTKMQAPDFVEPTGKPEVDESLGLIESSHNRLKVLKPLFLEFDGNLHRFPHPFFGHLSAIEWLVLIGQHKIRHTSQIRRSLEGSAM